MTGEDRFLEAAEAAPSTCASTCARRHATRACLLVPRHRGHGEPNEKKILASEFGDDYDAIPAYEQIYALAGPTQTYRDHRRPADPATTST